MEYDESLRLTSTQSIGNDTDLGSHFLSAVGQDRSMTPVRKKDRTGYPYLLDADSPSSSKHRWVLLRPYQRLQAYFCASFAPPSTCYHFNSASLFTASPATPPQGNSTRVSRTILIKVYRASTAALPTTPARLQASSTYTIARNITLVQRSPVLGLQRTRLSPSSILSILDLRLRTGTTL